MVMSAWLYDVGFYEFLQKSYDLARSGLVVMSGPDLD
jgi:hypothetical protein